MRKTKENDKFVMLGERDAKTGRIVKNEKYTLEEFLHTVIGSSVSYKSRFLYRVIPKKWVERIVADTLIHVMKRVVRAIDNDVKGVGGRKR